VEAVKLLPRAQFEADAGVRLANEYAQTKFEHERLTKRLDELKDEILEFARQNGVTVLQGKEAKVSVISRQRRKFPGKEDPLRAPLEVYLRKLGKWDNVLDLDVQQLLQVIDEEQWEPELLSQLRNFLSTTPSVSIQVSQSEGMEGKVN
jgi:hypothetical protein